jgi:hypothetical protein
VVVAGEVLVVVVLVVVIFSGPLAQDPNANRHAQTRQTPMDFFMSPILSQTGRRASKQASRKITEATTITELWL